MGVWIFQSYAPLNIQPQSLTKCNATFYTIQQKSYILNQQYCIFKTHSLVFFFNQKTFELFQKFLDINSFSTGIINAVKTRLCLISENRVRYSRQSSIGSCFSFINHFLLGVVVEQLSWGLGLFNYCCSKSPANLLKLSILL